jgi:uncharacterized protein YdiU (UPF0061 family)
MEKMWAAKLGIDLFNSDLFSELETLMRQTQVDYTMFFRELSTVPDDIVPLQKSFYQGARYQADSDVLDKRWSLWLEQWQGLNNSAPSGSNTETASPLSREALSSQMKRVNPKYTLREWFVVPAYKQAAEGNYSSVRELQDIMTDPYAEQSQDIEDKYYKRKPAELFQTGGLSHYSCSS